MEYNDKEGNPLNSSPQVPGPELARSIVSENEKREDQFAEEKMKAHIEADSVWSGYKEQYDHLEARAEEQRKILTDARKRYDELQETVEEGNRMSDVAKRHAEHMNKELMDILKGLNPEVEEIVKKDMAKWNQTEKDVMFKQYRHYWPQNMRELRDELEATFDRSYVQSASKIRDYYQKTAYLGHIRTELEQLRAAMDQAAARRDNYNHRARVAQKEMNRRKKEILRGEK